MDNTTKRNIIEKYLEEFPYAQENDKLFEALWGQNLLKKKYKIANNKQAIEDLCEAKLQSILLMNSNKLSHPKENDDIPQEYIDSLNKHRDNYSHKIEDWVLKWDIIPSTHIFSHIESDLVKYRSGSFLEKMQYARGISLMYKVKNWQDKKFIYWDYLWLDPEKLPLELIDLIKNGKLTDKHPQNQEYILSKRMLDNHDKVKDTLLDYTPLIIAKEEWYADSVTERIVSLSDSNWSTIWYVVSEDSPITYAEPHKKKYRWSEFRFKIFDKKTDLVTYLRNELKYIPAQQKRFEETIDYFTVQDPATTNFEAIEVAYKNFSHHGTYADQSIAIKLENLLGKNDLGDKRWKRQIVESIIFSAQKWILESKYKEEIMKKHLLAIQENLVM